MMARFYYDEKGFCCGADNGPIVGVDGGEIGKIGFDLCQMLGVEPDEVFSVDDNCEGIKWYRIHDGYRQQFCLSGWEKSNDERGLVELLSNPKFICKVDQKDVKKTVTKKELEFCKMIGAKYVSRDSRASWLGDRVDFWDGVPGKQEDVKECVVSYLGTDTARNISFLDADKMPSINIGECICVEDMITDE